jgi:hypothetical protein
VTPADPFRWRPRRNLQVVLACQHTTPPLTTKNINPAWVLTLMAISFPKLFEKEYKESTA